MRIGGGGGDRKGKSNAIGERQQGAPFKWGCHEGGSGQAYPLHAKDKDVGVSP